MKLMQKKNRKVILFSGLLIITLGMFLSGWWLEKTGLASLFINRFQLNAHILPASSQSRSLFLSINPNFRAEFGLKDNPTAAMLRFETILEEQQHLASNSAIKKNLWENLTNLPGQFREYYPGVEWQLFAVGLDEREIAKLDLINGDQENFSLAKKLLSNRLVENDNQIPQVLSQKQQIKTSTQLKREQGIDIIENLAVAENVDLNYRVLPGRGIISEIIIGDRQDFDLNCLSLLEITGENRSCNLPANSFSFLLQTDDGIKLQHTPFSIDGGRSGTYYFTNQDDQFLFRLANWQLIDAKGAKSQQIEFSLKQGEINNLPTDNYYVANLVGDLNWLLDENRVYPIKLQGGFLTSESDFFTPQ